MVIVFSHKDNANSQLIGKNRKKWQEMMMSGVKEVKKYKHACSTSKFYLQFYFLKQKRLFFNFLV